MRGEYALSVACLATMWEGLIRFKTSMEGTRRCSKRTTEDFAQLVTNNDLTPLFGKFYSELIVGQCDTENDVIPGIPNRNGVSHTKIKGYPNKKASLNAILLTDFIINMTTIDVMEETSNGTT